MAAARGGCAAGEWEDGEVEGEESQAALLSFCRLLSSAPATHTDSPARHGAVRPRAQCRTPRYLSDGRSFSAKRKAASLHGRSHRPHRPAAAPTTVERKS